MTGNDERTTIEKKADFLRHFADSGNVTKSALETRIDRTTVYRWKKEDPEFGVAFDEAEEMGGMALEDEAHRRAFEGSLIVTKNGSYRQHSDLLTIFLLKARFPEKYIDKSRTELTGANGAPLVTPPDDDKMAVKLGQILAAAMSRKAKANEGVPALPAPSGDDYDDIC